MTDFMGFGLSDRFKKKLGIEEAPPVVEEKPPAPSRESELLQQLLEATNKEQPPIVVPEPTVINNQQPDVELLSAIKALTETLSKPKAPMVAVRDSEGRIIKVVPEQ